MIIACPHCQTKYQVTYEAIGSAGRKVQCAHCQQAWQQSPLGAPAPSDQEKAAVEAMVEDELDEALLAEEKAAASDLAKRLADEDNHHKSAIAAKLDPALVRSRQRAFSKRQDAIAGRQPLAQLRRAVRIGLALLLCSILAGAYFGRTQIVERYPAMAGVYEALGLSINLVGLDFTNVTTQRTLRNGKDMLIVSAQLVGLNRTPTAVPAVVVTLLDSRGEIIYAWSIAPSVPDLMAGERATFDTQLVMPPGEAERVRLGFGEIAEAPASTPQVGGSTAAAHPQPIAAAAEHAAEPVPTPPEHH